MSSPCPWLHFGGLCTGWEQGGRAAEPWQGALQPCWAQGDPPPPSAGPGTDTQPGNTPRACQSMCSSLRFPSGLGMVSCQRHGVPASVTPRVTLLRDPRATRPWEKEQPSCGHSSNTGTVPDMGHRDIEDDTRTSLN